MQRAISILGIALVTGCFSPDDIPPVTSQSDDGFRTEPVPGPTVVTSEIYFNDFDGGERIPSGVSVILAGAPGTNLTGVQGFAGFGFSGAFARNTSGTSTPTSIQLSNLPPHESVSIETLFALIDSWDGLRDINPDQLDVAIDGTSIFSHVMCTCEGDLAAQSYVPPAGVRLAYLRNLGFTDEATNNFFYDSAYDFGKEPTFQNIPHSGSTLTISIRASGNGWDGGPDESFAIDNFRVVLTHTEGP